MSSLRPDILDAMIEQEKKVKKGLEIALSGSNIKYEFVLSQQEQRPDGIEGPTCVPPLGRCYVQFTKDDVSYGKLWDYREKQMELEVESPAFAAHAGMIERYFGKHVKIR